MNALPLNPNDLAVETFDTGTADAMLLPTQKPGTMKTYEPGCTLPELCPTDTTVAYAA